MEKFESLKILFELVIAPAVTFQWRQKAKRDSKSYYTESVRLSSVARPRSAESEFFTCGFKRPLKE
jgi:hypothetical protein